MDIKYSVTGPHNHWEVMDNGRSVGFLDWDQAADEAQITDLQVQKDFRRKKYATRLLEELLYTAKEKSLNKIFLEVRETNKIAITLYTKLGFQQIGTRKDYYKDPTENALVLARII